MASPRVPEGWSGHGWREHWLAVLDCLTGLDTQCPELPERPFTPQLQVDVQIVPPPVSRAVCWTHVILAFGQKSDYLLRRLSTSDVICVAGPALAESLAA